MATQPTFPLVHRVSLVRRNYPWSDHRHPAWETATGDERVGKNVASFEKDTNGGCEEMLQLSYSGKNVLYR